MTDGFEQRRKALEGSYFEKQNEEKLKALANKKISPVSGNPMIQEQFLGITIDRCPDSGGIWLDAGELENILKQVKAMAPDTENFLTRFISELLNK